MIEKLGFQAWSVKEHMQDKEGIRNTFQRLAAMGYDNVQTAGKMVVSHEEYAQLAKEAGLTVCGTHANFDEMTADPQKAMEEHRILGTNIIGIGGYGVSTMQDVDTLIKRVNDFAAIIGKEGFKFTYHNHHGEFRKFDGNTTIMDRLIDGFDPDVVSFCLDTYWVQAGGYDVRHMMERLDGRIDILHLKDMQINMDCSYQSTEVGSGNLWWDGIVPLAEQIGVKYYVVEQEAFTMDQFESMRRSSEFLHRYMK